MYRIIVAGGVLKCDTVYITAKNPICAADGLEEKNEQAEETRQLTLARLFDGS